VTYGEGLVKRVSEAARDGVDAALDAVGSGVLPELIELTGGPEKVISIADYSAGKYGVRVSSGMAGRYVQALDKAVELFEQGKFSMPVQQTFPLEQAPEAHRVSQEGHVRGKLVLTTDYMHRVR
jgi:NADPH:quinone reductase-like Zn-dependent oxidoreductase